MLGLLAGSSGLFGWHVELYLPITQAQRHCARLQVGVDERAGWLCNWSFADWQRRWLFSILITTIKWEWAVTIRNIPEIGVYEPTKS
jgi:hypothetical protein